MPLKRGSVGIITAEPITTLAELEAVYQQAIRGRHISEIAPILALRNKALEALLDINGILETIRHNESVDDHGDPVGAQPETQWEVGYAAGVRCIYRFLKNAAPQALTDKDVQPVASPAVAAPIVPLEGQPCACRFSISKDELIEASECGYHKSRRLGFEYICKCGIRVSPHVCGDGTDF